MRLRATTWRAAVAIAGLLAVLLTARPADAAPTVYHSPGDTGEDPGQDPPHLPTGSPRTVYLYLDPGPNATTNQGSLCNAGAGGVGGNGDETCGLHFRIEVSGDLSILGFTPQVGSATSKITGSQLTAAVVTTAQPLPPGPTRIGTCTYSPFLS